MESSISKLRLDYLNTFNFLVKYKSFSETARILNKTQGTISMHIKELEHAFGGTNHKQLLIDRNSKNFQLTPEGFLLYSATQKVEEIINNVSKKIDESIGKKQKIIEIQSSSIPGEYILPAYILKYNSKHTNVMIEALISNSQEALRRMRESKSTFCAIGGWFGEFEADYDVKVIGKDTIVIIGREKHPIFDKLKKRGINYSRDDMINDLKEYNWIFRESGSATLDWFMKHFPRSQEIQIGLKFHNNSSILHALENSDALTALSSFVVPSTVKNWALKVIKHKTLPIIERNLYLIKRKGIKLQDFEQKFWDLFNH
ncbi:hypothetical protein NEF87_001904 [Candidatus Lokiarchaeum ossiferum]|uniref:HTH lysR-type domain-containing protein n=1 Tax=Candidatus Lokiarchaeum ossiferum TaxID=2951803 RepID=A0ABY6HSS2_9ARCH|nr:hypothetical protein NEF87_001904 [Candidatus Lokiarchaeum sp. B-35]